MYISLGLFAISAGITVYTMIEDYKWKKQSKEIGAMLVRHQKELERYGVYVNLTDEE